MVRFLDYDAVIADLRRATRDARAEYPDIARVLLFGSLVNGTWTADSDADLIVVVRREFTGLLDRAPYQVFSRLIPTDTLVYSESEFERMRAEPFLSEALATAVEL